MHETWLDAAEARHENMWRAPTSLDRNRVYEERKQVQLTPWPRRHKDSFTAPANPIALSQGRQLKAAFR